LPARPVHLSNSAGERIYYYPPTTVLITRGDFADEEPKDAVRLSISTNQGKSWKELKLPLPSEKYREGLIACDTPNFVDARHGWLPFQMTEWRTNMTLAWSAMAFYTTSDGGQSWAINPGTIDRDTNNFLSDQFCAISANTAFFRTGSKLYVTRNAAKSWRLIEPNVDFASAISHGGSLQLDFVDPTRGWVVFSRNGVSQLYKTLDGGCDWILCNGNPSSR
jgi:hypothetical protein